MLPQLIEKDGLAMGTARSKDGEGIDMITALRLGACVALSLCVGRPVCADALSGSDGWAMNEARRGNKKTTARVDHSSGATLVIIPALPPILGQRLRRQLGMHDIPISEFENAETTSIERNGDTGVDSSSPATKRGKADIAGASRARSHGHDGAAISRRYFLTDLGTLGGTESFAYGVNDIGQIVGSSRIVGDTSTHAFLYSNGGMTDLSPLNSGNIQAVGPSSINNSGQIASGLVVGGVYLPAIFDSRSGDLTLLGSLGGVTDFGFSGVATSVNKVGDAVGYSHIDATNRHAFLYANGLLTDIGSLGGSSVAFGANDTGTIVGFADTSEGRSHAFVYSGGLMTDITPDSSESYARGVNNLGQVVGQFLIQDQTAHHAFLYSEGTFYDIGIAESLETVAFAINDQGQIVGTTLVEDVCFDPNQGAYQVCTQYTQHAFFYQAGQVTDLNAVIPANSGWDLEWAFDINNHGQIVGYGSVNDRFRAFVLTPAVSKEQCKKGAWQKFGFKNQGQCIQFVHTGR